MSGKILTKTKEGFWKGIKLELKKKIEIKIDALLLKKRKKVSKMCSP